MFKYIVKRKDFPFDKVDDDTMKLKFAPIQLIWHHRRGVGVLMDWREEQSTQMCFVEGNLGIPGGSGHRPKYVLYQESLGLIRLRLHASPIGMVMN